MASDEIKTGASSEQRTSGASAIPLVGIGLLVMICAMWGGNIVSIKVSNQGIPPFLAATCRSIVSVGLIGIYALIKGERLFFPGPDIKHGVVIGFLFGLDFFFLYWGTSFTHASRAVIFLYTHPFFVALGAHFIISDDRLSPLKGIGLVLAFIGVTLVFGARSAKLGELHWVGDLMEICAAISWAATTLYIKKVLSVKKVSAMQTLFAQLFFAIPVLLIAYLIFEFGDPVRLSTKVVLAFGYQSVVIAFFSYFPVVLDDSPVHGEQADFFYVSGAYIRGAVERDRSRGIAAFTALGRARPGRVRHLPGEPSGKGEGILSMKSGRSSDFRRQKA